MVYTTLMMGVCNTLTYPDLCNRILTELELDESSIPYAGNKFQRKVFGDKVKNLLHRKYENIFKDVIIVIS